MNKPKYNELSIEKQAKIVEMYKNNIPSTKIAEMENTNPSTVLKYVRKHGGIAKSFSDAFSKYDIMEDFFKNIDTEEKAYWLGFMYSDGHINKYGDIIIALAIIDKGHLEKFLKSLKCSYPIRIKVNTNSFGTFTNGRVDIRNIKMRDDLLNCGLGYDKSFKFEIKLNDNLLLKHFWRGVIDGDGSFGFLRDNSPFFTLVGNKDSLLAFQKYIWKNLKIYISVVKHKTIYACKAGGLATKEIVNFLYKDSKIYLDRKYVKYNDLLTYVPKDLSRCKQRKGSLELGNLLDIS